MESINERLARIEKLIGQPSSENSKSLFEILGALNKEVLELRLKIEEMKLKENQEKI